MDILRPYARPPYPAPSSVTKPLFATVEMVLLVACHKTSCCAFPPSVPRHGLNSASLLSLLKTVPREYPSLLLPFSNQCACLVLLPPVPIPSTLVLPAHRCQYNLAGSRSGESHSFTVRMYCWFPVGRRNTIDRFQDSGVCCRKLPVQRSFDTSCCTVGSGVFTGSERFNWEISCV